VISRRLESLIPSSPPNKTGAVHSSITLVPGEVTGGSGESFFLGQVIIQPKGMRAIIAMRMSDRPMLIGSMIQLHPVRRLLCLRRAIRALARVRRCSKLFECGPPKACPPPLTSRGVGISRWQLCGKPTRNNHWRVGGASKRETFAVIILDAIGCNTDMMEHGESFVPGPSLPICGLNFRNAQHGFRRSPFLSLERSFGLFHYKVPGCRQ
jgi:hypothetical protein